MPGARRLPLVLVACVVVGVAAAGVAATRPWRAHQHAPRPASGPAPDQNLVDQGRALAAHDGNTANATQYATLLQSLKPRCGDELGSLITKAYSSLWNGAAVGAVPALGLLQYADHAVPAASGPIFRLSVPTPCREAVIGRMIAQADGRPDDAAADGALIGKLDARCYGGAAELAFVVEATRQDFSKAGVATPSRAVLLGWLARIVPATASSSNYCPDPLTPCARPSRTASRARTRR